MVVTIIKDKDQSDKIIVTTDEVKTDRQAAALRRSIYSSLPLFAISDVEIYSNTSNLDDEFIAHRLGLIRIVINDDIFFDAYPLGSEHESEKIVLYLDITAEDNKVVVTSKDIVLSTDKISMADVTICQLRKGQSLKVVAYVEKNVGKVHAKYSAITSVIFEKTIVAGGVSKYKENANMFKDIMEKKKDSDSRKKTPFTSTESNTSESSISGSPSANTINEFPENGESKYISTGYTFEITFNPVMSFELFEFQLLSLMGSF